MIAEMRTKLAVSCVVAVALTAVAVGFIWSARTAPSAAVGTHRAPTLPAGPGLVFLRNRRLATASGLNGSGPVGVSTVECMRAYAAACTVACLHQDTAWTYSLRVLDAELHQTSGFELTGLPNRAQVSASGRMVAWTSFVGGDSYNGGQFATRTGILDTRTGRRVDSLEPFSVRHRGRPYRNRDRNFWGVTFAADDNRFYATMSTSGRRYLVRGDYAAGTLQTVAENVECPSLSPDGTRLAFKQANDADPDNGWRLSVLDLRTLRITRLAETRSIDDQAAWSSAAEVAYTVRDSSGTPSVWSTPSDGSGRPRRLLSAAESPSFLPVE
jgi:WD40 repeat protein